MGIYLNPNNTLFREDLNSRIYVDKSMIIAELNALFQTYDKYLCVSRPRRFGKSMAGNMISAYYSKGCDSRELFKNLKIAQDASFEKNLNKYNVIKFDLNGFLQNCRDRLNLISIIEETIRNEIAAAYPDIEFTEKDSLGNSMLKVFASTGETFVIIIDEYDVLVREQVPSSVFESYLNFLSSLFKNADLKPAISLAYLTGILPIVRDKIQSKMNEFGEYSMTTPKQLAQFVGFTEEETRQLCAKYDMDFAECERWYNGYHLKKDLSVYSPRSVISAMQNGDYKSYWTVTGSYEALKNYILMNFDGIRDDVVTMIGGGRVAVDIFSYMNTMTEFKNKDDVFTYLVHLGYLAYDSKEETCYIPNYEVRREWITSIKMSSDYTQVMKIVNASKELVERTIECDEEYIATALDDAHTQATNPLTYNDEKSFQSAIGIAYFYATSKYTIVKELPTGRGFADIAFIPYVPNVPAIIVELKNNKTATGAIEQIKAKKYADALRHYEGNLIFVGINYDEKTKVHTCKIEKLEI